MIISRKIINEITSRSDLDKESCGFLAGDLDENYVIIKEYFFVKNISRSSYEFIMDPYDMLRVIKEIESRGMKIVGLFHTHLGHHPNPSYKDLEGMRSWPIPWLIIDKFSGEYRAWIKSDDKLKSIEIEVVD
jgi:proteasome lid subunit RPN8/RPN11